MTASRRGLRKLAMPRDCFFLVADRAFPVGKPKTIPRRFTFVGRPGNPRVAPRIPLVPNHRVGIAKRTKELVNRLNVNIGRFDFLENVLWCLDIYDVKTNCPFLSSSLR